MHILVVKLQCNPLSYFNASSQLLQEHKYSNIWNLELHEHKLARTLHEQEEHPVCFLC